MSKPKVIVALPAFNEGKYVHGIIVNAKQYADEVIVLNDGSLDDTARVAREAGAVVISHERNMGYGATIRSILEEGKKRDFDAFVIMDADEQHNPDDIPCLVEPIFNGYDLAIGCRKRIDIPRYRYVGGKVLSIFTRVLSGKNVEDSQCGFRAFSPKAVRSLNLKENGMAISSEMLVEVGRNNLKIKEVPISIKYTDDSSTQNPVYQGFYTLFRIMLMMVRKPFRKGG